MKKISGIPVVLSGLIVILAIIAAGLGIFWQGAHFHFVIAHNFYVFDNPTA